MVSSGSTVLAGRRKHLWPSAQSIDGWSAAVDAVLAMEAWYQPSAE